MLSIGSIASASHLTQGEASLLQAQISAVLNTINDLETQLAQSTIEPPPPPATTEKGLIRVRRVGENNGVMTSPATYAVLRKPDATQTEKNEANPAVFRRLPAGYYEVIVPTLEGYGVSIGICPDNSAGTGCQVKTFTPALCKEFQCVAPVNLEKDAATRVVFKYTPTTGRATLRVRRAGPEGTTDSAPAGFSEYKHENELVSGSSKENPFVTTRLPRGKYTVRTNYESGYDVHVGTCRKNRENDSAECEITNFKKADCQVSSTLGPPMCSLNISLANQVTTKVVFRYTKSGVTPPPPVGDTPLNLSFDTVRDTTLTASQGVTASVCQINAKELILRIPVGITLNGIYREFGVSIVPGELCGSKTYSYEEFGLMYEAGKQYIAAVQIDPKDIYKERVEQDNIRILKLAGTRDPITMTSPSASQRWAIGETNIVRWNTDEHVWGSHAGYLLSGACEGVSLVNVLNGSNGACKVVGGLVDHNNMRASIYWDRIQPKDTQPWDSYQYPRAGQYFIGIQDRGWTEGSLVGESVISKQFSLVYAGRADLAVDSIKTSSVGLEGDREAFTVTGVVRNIGGETSSRYRVKFMVCREGNYPCENGIISSITNAFDGLASGQTVTVNNSMTLERGGYYIKYQVVPDGSDRRLQNDILTRYLQVGNPVIPPPPPPGTLTQGQIDAIISLLQSFGATSNQIANVRITLTGGTPANIGPSPLTNLQVESIISLLQSFGASNSIIANTKDVLYGSIAPPPPPPAFETIQNPNFETGSLGPWRLESYAGRCTAEVQSGVGVRGSSAAVINCPAEDDARLVQTVRVQPRTDYLLSGYIRTENVANSSQTNNVGANISLMDTWEHSDGIRGTSEWKVPSLRFNSGDKSEIVIGLRLGHWGGVTTGKVYFDAIGLSRVIPPIPPPPPAGIARVESVSCSSSSITPGADLYCFRVSAVGGDIALQSLAFGVATSSVTVRDFRLYGPDGSVHQNAFNAFDGTANDIGDADYLHIIFGHDEPNRIHAGESKTYRLRADTVIPPSGGSTGALTIFLRGDANALPLPDGKGTILDIERLDRTLGNFIWTGNTSMSDAWVNGHGVQTLPLPSRTMTSVAYAPTQQAVQLTGVDSTPSNLASVISSLISLIDELTLRLIP